MKKIYLYIILAISFASCATLPKATVEMSMLLEKQITALEQSHLKIIQLYFDEREQQSLNFLNNKWYPQYLDNFFKQQAVIGIWNECVKTNDPTERIENIKLITQVVNEEYMKMRDSLLLPLSKAEKELTTVIEQEYKKALSMNNAITNNVASVNAIQEKRKEMLSKIIDTDNIDAKINATLLQADSVLNKIQKAYLKNESTIENVIQRIKK